jgi:hypothetical protein
MVDAGSGAFLLSKALFSHQADRRRTPQSPSLLPAALKELQERPPKANMPGLAYLGLLGLPTTAPWKPSSLNLNPIKKPFHGRNGLLDKSEIGCQIDSPRWSVFGSVAVATAAATAAVATTTAAAVAAATAAIAAATATVATTATATTGFGFVNADHATHPLHILEIVNRFGFIGSVGELDEGKTPLATGFAIQRQAALTNLAVLAEQILDIIHLAVEGKIADVNSHELRKS